MRKSFGAWLAVCAWVMIALSLVGAVVVAGVDEGPVSLILVWAVPVVGCGLVGGLLVVRVARNPVGWVFVTIGVALGVGILCDSVVVASAGGSRVVTVATVGEFLLEPLPVFVLPVLLLFFPDGHLASSRWRPIAWVAAVAVTVVAVAALGGSGSSSSLLGADAPSPLAQDGSLGSVLAAVGAVGWLALSRVLVVSAAGLVVRFRNAQGVVRQQLKWFGLGASGLAAAGVVDYLLPTTLGTSCGPWPPRSLWVLSDSLCMPDPVFGSLLGLPETRKGVPAWRSLRQLSEGRVRRSRMRLWTSCFLAGC